MSAFAATVTETGSDFAREFTTTENMWSGNQTPNLIPTPTLPAYSTNSGTDVESWKAYWNNTMVPDGWGSANISIDADSLQVYSGGETGDTFAIRPTTKGTDDGASAHNSCLGGAGNPTGYNGGVSYTVELSTNDQTLANAGKLTVSGGADFYAQKDEQYYHAITFAFYNGNGETLNKDKTVRATQTPTAEQYITRELNDISVPQNTKYIRIWFYNYGMGNARKAVKNFQAFLEKTDDGDTQTATGIFKKCTGELTSGYYVFGVGESAESIAALNTTVSSNWIRFATTTSASDRIINPDSSIVWYYDATTGKFNNGINYIAWPTTGNSAGCNSTGTPLTIAETATTGVYNITVSATPSRMLRLNGTSGYRFYTTSTGTNTYYFFKLSDEKISPPQIATHSVLGTGTSYSYSFKMTSPEAKTGIFLVALYNGERLVGVKTIPLTTAKTEYTNANTITTESQATTYKIMFWSGLDTLKPLCEAASGNVENGTGTLTAPYLVNSAAELQNAIDSTENETNYIKLGSDFSADTQILQESTDNPFVLDFNGKTITSSETLSIRGTATFKNGTFESSGYQAVQVSMGGTLEITNTAVMATDTYSTALQIMDGRVTGNNVYLTGGMYAYVNEMGTLILDGEIMQNFELAGSYHTHKDADNDGYCDLGEEEMETGTGRSSDPYIVKNAAALQSVLKSTANTITYIKLGDHITANSVFEVTKTTTVLDLNEKTLSFTGNGCLSLQQATTLQNGSVISENAGISCNSGNSVLENLTVYAGGDSAVGVYDGNVTITNCTLEGIKPASSYSYGLEIFNFSKVTANNVTLMGTSGAYRVASDQPTFTLDGAKAIGTCTDTTYKTTGRQ